MDNDTVKKSISELVERFRQAEETGALKKYSEEDTKKNFIMPLFRALGWDIDGPEVVAEENITRKRVDYGFYIDGHIQFYLEAKAAKEDTEQEKFANQAISYSWNKGITWAVLTNFKLLEIFNVEDPTARISAKRFKSIRFDEYVDRFDELRLLSRESCEQKLLDTEAEKVGKKLKRISVTAKLVEDLNDARDQLSYLFAAWNPELASTPILLDEGVQRVLDRIIFIRVAEDRGIEDPTLRPLIRKWEADRESGNEEALLYQAMEHKFRELDAIYNSNIFAPHPSDHWQEYKNAIKDIVEKFYGKEGYYAYDFKIIPADVLGTVYEQYLGHRLARSMTKNLLGEVSMSVAKDARKRKEQGIYYTPRFIVDYIVEQALGPVLAECKTITDLQKIKILDPACGSGSFLIKALELIYAKYQVFGARGEEVRLQILINNLYGVDLDEQAVEIARLNLLLASLEKRQKLPNLTNIRNGNSLISGTDEELKKRFGKNWRDKKPFNWEKEFPEVFKQGGFDVVIGNPPYIKEYVNKSAFDGLHESPYYQGKMDIWTMFASIAIDLLKDKGVLSFIAPNNWVTNAGASNFRNKILTDGELKTFIDFGDYKVFDAAGIQTMVFVFEKGKPQSRYEVEYMHVADKSISEAQATLDIRKEKPRVSIEPNKLLDKNITFPVGESSSVLDKIESKRNFEFTEREVGQGIVAAPDKYFLEDVLSNYDKEEQSFLKKYYTAAGRYESGKSVNYIFYICDRNFSGKKLDDYINIKKHFEPFKPQLVEAKKKYGTPDKPYFYLHREREERFFKAGPKIVCGVRVTRPSFFYTTEPYYGSRALNFIVTDRIDLKFLCAILNSSLTFYWLKHKGKHLGDLLQVDKSPLLTVPIYVGSKAQQKSASALVDKMIELNALFHKETENSEKWKKLKVEIERTDKEIDQEVYKLYGLTPEEIKIVEDVK